MRVRTMVSVVAILIVPMGCRSVPKPPRLPEPPAVESATGERRVLLEQIRQMAGQDAPMARR